MPVQDVFSSNALLQPKSIQDYDQENLLMQAKQQAIQTSAIANQQAVGNLQKQQAMLQQQGGLRQAVQSGQYDLNNPDHQAALVAQFPDAAPNFLDAVQKSKTNTALANKDQGSANESNAKATDQAMATMRSGLSLVRSPQDMAQWIHGMFTNPATAATAQAVSGSEQQAIARIPTNPAQFQQYLQQNAVGMENYMKNATTQRGQDLDLQGHKIQAGATLGAAQIGANASMSNNANTIRKDLTVAGMNPDGSPSANIESEAQLVAAGKMPPPTGMAATRPAAAMLMARVSQINPDYDATTYGAKAAAAKGFTSGQQGNALRSISTADDHLGQLDQLGDALNNGNVKVLNNIGNAFGVQTGAAPAQVFNAVKNVVGQEVVKAIVAGGGSAGERDEAAKAFAADSSPAQLKQTIAAYRSVMGAQKTNLLEQRRAAGLPDSTLPNYAPPTTAPAAGGWKYVGPVK